MHQLLARNTLLALILQAVVLLTSTPAHSEDATREHRPNSELNQIRILIRTGRLSDAVKRLDMISENKRNSSEHFFLRGRAMQELKRNTDALADYTISIFLDKSNIRARINRALTRGALGDINGALKELNEAARIAPNNHVILMNRGVTLAGLNRPQEGIREFDRAIRIYRKYADAYRNRGIVRHYLKDEPGACRDWRQASSYGDEEAYQWVSFYCTKQSSSKGRTQH